MAALQQVPPKIKPPLMAAHKSIGGGGGESTRSKKTRRRIRRSPDPHRSIERNSKARGAIRGERGCALRR